MESIVIPYTAAPRPDTGVTNVSLGIWLFLASEVMLFGALFSAYALLRVSAVEWPASGRAILGAGTVLINTFALVLASAAVWDARRRAIAGGKAPHVALLVSSAFALLFIVIKATEYSSKLAAGLLPSSSMFLALFYTLTAFHALHVIGGMIANLWVVRSVRMLDLTMIRGRIRAIALYWLFVDVVWLAILVAFYAT